MKEAPTNTHLFHAGCEKLAKQERRAILVKASGALVDKYVSVISVGGKKRSKKEKEPIM